MEGVEKTAGVRAGDVLAGKYRIEKVLGVGGMGVVVAARHLQLETNVAIKFLLPEMLADGEAVGRFAREARAAVRITGEHVARVLDVGTLETGAPFMVMEFLEGGDLSAWLQQRGVLTVELAVEFLLQACVAVAEAHSLGIVHRDLKPANLFCIRRADGKASIKVLDFGISKLTDLTSSDGAMSVTKTNSLMGSPLYMSPEQMQSTKTVDAQTDVWALGVILYELLAGRVPFDGETVPEVAIKVATQSPAPMEAFRAGVPPGLEVVILKSLEKTKAARYRSVAELALALRPFAPSRARPLVDRICGILQVGSPGSMAPQEIAPPFVGEPTAAAGTMGAVVSTTPGARTSRTRIVALSVLGGVGTIGAVALAVFLKHGGSANWPSTTTAVGGAPAAPIGMAVVTAPAQPVDPGTLRVAPLPADLPLPSASAPSAPVPRGLAPRAAHRPPPAPAKPTASPPSAPAGPSPTPARPAPAPSKNHLDLGNFQ